MTSDSLTKNIKCLITRPAHQSQGLNDKLTEVGYGVISLPTIAITATTETAFHRQLNSQIQGYDLVLFVSRNAVEFAFKYIRKEDLSSHTKFGVIGQGTCQALQQQEMETQVVPVDNYNSEGLLASSQLQEVKNKRVLIFRGQEGRNLLGDTLRERGAKVEYCEVYQRVLPNYSSNFFAALIEEGFPDVVVFTSSEGMENIFKLVSNSEAEALRTIPWLLISERMRETASNLRHNGAIIIAKKASDQGIIDALQEWKGV